ncbi:MAG: SpoIIE family protein phosphatase [Bacteroidales bacterium]|nr:SpoIIE family protein phosphatase [Bacteroidales bacterium]
MFFGEEEDQFFIEIAHTQEFKNGQVVGGDTFLSRSISGTDRFGAILSDGLGSGIRANVLSTLTASMAMNYMLHNRPLPESLRTILDTLPEDAGEKISYATCSMFDIDRSGEAHIVEYDNPDYILLRGSRHFETRKRSLKINTRQGVRSMLESRVMLFKGDRLIFFSDGVTQSGLGSVNYPAGWERSGVISFLEDFVSKHPEISAKELSKIVMQKALHNDLFIAKDDITCAVVYLRAPRRVLICTGPPFDKGRDKEMAYEFDNYNGKRVVCGGTTAQILSRELGRRVTGDGRHQLKTILPSTAKMEGAELVTEGILTLGHLADLLQNWKEGSKIEDSPAGDILALILQHDIIDILMGTRINEAHYDPSLPVEMEIRRNLVRRLKVLLEGGNFMKKVRIKYI